jgi:predicted MPP superfamily phosphohydrolase
VGKKTVWFVPQYLYDMDPETMIASLRAQIADMESTGKQYDAQGGALYRALLYRLDSMLRTQEAIRLMKDGDLQIAVNHAPLEPDYIRTSLEWADQTQVFNFRRISLLLCGHVCAGQWRLPGVGPIFMPDMGWFPGDSGLIGRFVDVEITSAGRNTLRGRRIER